MKIAATYPHIQRPATATEALQPKGRVRETVEVDQKSDKLHQEHNSGRAHVMQEIKQMEREVRHAVKDEFAEMKAAGTFDKSLFDSVKDLAKDFGADLRDAFHAAGRGNSFDPIELPDSIVQAMADFRTALHNLLGGDSGVVPEADRDGDLMVDPPELTEMPNPVGGTLLDTSA
jgi:SpoVK/Ycf46/Vps4 family AAA+-type ATPase